MNKNRKVFTLKNVGKFALGTIVGSLLTISIYASADNGTVLAPVNNQFVSTIPADQVSNFAKVYAIAKNYYVESVSDDNLMKGAITGMLSNLDPHSDYLDADDFKKLSEITSGSFAGLGLEVSREKNSGVKVVAPIFGTPAYRAGVQSGDIIIKIDNASTVGMSLDEAVKKMRGKAGTKVVLTVSRANELKPLSFTIIRDKIEVKSVQSTMLDKNYGYVRITNFQADTSNELAKALDKLYKENPNIKGLILDLRDDPGGILQSAVGVSGAFLPKDSLVVYTDGRLESSKTQYYVKPSDYSVDGTQEQSLKMIPAVYKTLPLVVLVNQGTASASEIVSGALQDYKRAKIVGTKTFGKGSVQTVIPLSKDTALKLTTALYYTPNGRSIQAQGISPDIIIQSEYSELFDSWDVSEASYENHLNNPTGKESANKLSSPVPVIRPPKQITTKDEIKAKADARLKLMPKVHDQTQAQVDLQDDFQLQWALNIIEGKPLPKDSTHSKAKK